MMRIGWLHDDLGIVGGAELSSETLIANRPQWVTTIVKCPPTHRPPVDMDAYIVTNCFTYSHQWIEELSIRPVVKVIRDDWNGGSIQLRRWLLDNSALLIFGSPTHKRQFQWPSTAAMAFVPPPVDLELFKAAALPPEQRCGNVFVGRVDTNKGAHRAIDWALAHGEPLDLYGTRYIDFGGDLPENIRFHGRTDYSKLPAIYGAAKRFVFLPAATESYSRTTVEAWAAGCELMVDESRIGAMWWIEHSPADIGRGVEMFWAEVKIALFPEW
jgi:glycosyltransferase involved in cell wall biosynthesis